MKLSLAVASVLSSSAVALELDGKKMILLGTNNYLGLTFDDDCVAAAKGAIDQYGTGTTGSRSIL